MKKKQYINPLTEVAHVNTLLMQALGEASMPKNPFAAPERRKTEVF